MLSSMTEWSMNIDLEMYGKKRPWPDLKYCPGICLEKQRKATKVLIRMVGLLSEIWTKDFPNTKQQCYLLSCEIQNYFILRLKYSFFRG
jgi:hypothetical protein